MQFVIKTKIELFNKISAAANIIRDTLHTTIVFWFGSEDFIYKYQR